MKRDTFCPQQNLQRHPFNTDQPGMLSADTDQPGMLSADTDQPGMLSADTDQPICSSDLILVVVLLKVKNLLICHLDKHALYELCREKTCLRGFGPGPIQIGLYSHRS